MIKSIIIMRPSSATKILLVLFLSIFLVLNGRSTVLAQNDRVSILVSPPTFELTANAGGELLNSIKVTNTSDRPIEIKTDKRNFTAMGEEGSVVLDSEDNGRFSLASWIFVQPSDATILPGETKIFEYQIKVPVDAEPGGHFGSIVFVSGQQAKPGIEGAAVSQEVASLVLLRIAGDVKEEAEIETFKAGKNYFEYAPVDFETRVKNNGSVHIKPNGFISITNIFGKQIARIDVNTKNVFPGAIRKFDDKWEDNYLFGKYTATLVLNYSNERKTLTKTTSFIVFPHKIAGAVLGTIIVIIFIMIKIRKRLSLAFRVLFGKQDLERSMPKDRVSSIRD